MAGLEEHRLLLLSVSWLGTVFIGFPHDAAHGAQDTGLDSVLLPCLEGPSSLGISLGVVLGHTSYSAGVFTACCSHWDFRCPEAVQQVLVEATTKWQNENTLF